MLILIGCFKLLLIFMNFLLNLRQINCTRTVCSKKLNGLMYIVHYSICIHSSKQKISVNFEN